ncbi:uncharacterized protein SOCE836_064520 [Sorangium cellulosum]|uniref:Fe2OG dioxygenase domain-containing protein n=2 Tax=Polyangiaceae TaxID=49 RepID=A0A4P2QVY2_SORCE|nr:uncharacterized protein SOCE836_064520 [Sorangium cellulosum]WCQ93599.1 hypothetical protein NQZ70_06351 [Sorangium sp. Soce836]
MQAVPLSAERAIYRRPSFLDAATCAALCAEMRRASGAPGAVLNPRYGASGPREIVDVAARKTSEVEVSPESRALVRRLFERAIGGIARHTGIRDLALRYEHKFLVYRPGDYFVFHRDRDDAPDDPPYVRERRVSLVLYLNDAAEEPSPTTFGGGAIRFLAHDLDPEAASDRRRVLSLSPTAGLLVAFDPRVMHEVRLITHGERCTAVNWLY